MTEKDMILKYHCNTEMYSSACDYAQYTEDDPMCQSCAIQFIADLRAYKLSSDHRFKSKYRNYLDNYWRSKAMTKLEEMKAKQGYPNRFRMLQWLKALDKRFKKKRKS